MQAMGEKLKGAADLRVEPAQGAVRRRIPELAVGVVLIGLGAIAVLVLTGGDDAPTEVVILAADVSRGEAIRATDLTSVGLTATAPVNVVSAVSAEAFVGKTATSDLSAGSFLTDADVADAAGVPAGFALLGMRLAAGAYPSSQVRPGDHVDVLGLPVDRVAGTEVADEESEVAELVASAVEVARFQPLGTDPGSDVFVSLLVAESQQTEVAAVAGSGRIWLTAVSS